LTVVTVERARDAVAHDDVIEATSAWLADRDLRLLEAEVDVDEGTVFLELEGPRKPESLAPLAERLAGVLGQEVELEADWVRSERMSVSGVPWGPSSGGAGRGEGVVWGAPPAGGGPSGRVCR